MADDYRNTYNDTTRPLGALTAGGARTGAIETGSDDDVFAISLVAGRTYIFDLKGAGAGGGSIVSPYLTLLDASGSYLAAGYGFTADNAQIVYTATASGTYYLVAEGGTSTATGTYTLAASAGYNDDYRDTYTATHEPLGALAAGGSRTGIIEIGGDDDVFAISLVAGRTYVLNVKGAAAGGGTLVDSYAELYKADGSYLGGSFSINGDARVVYTAATSGTYYVVAQGGYSTSTGTYTVSGSAGYVDDYRDAYNSTIEALGTLTAGGSRTGNLEMAGDKDVFAITLTAGRTYNLDVVSTAAGGGTLGSSAIEVYASDGSYIGYGYDAGSGTARVTYTAATTGTYYVYAEGGMSTDSGTYTVRASAGYVDDYRDIYTSTIEALGSVTPGGSATGAIEIGGDRDVFAISLTAGQTYTIDLRGAAGGGGTLSGTDLELLQQDGTFAAVGNTVNLHDSRITYTAGTTGTYYIVAEGALTTATGTYTLSVSGSFADDYRDIYTDTSEPLGALSAGGSRTGRLEVAGDKDVFAITLSAGRSYTFDLKGVAGSGGTLANPYLALTDPTGALVALNDDLSASSADARITHVAVTSGKYYLTAQSGTTGGTGTYTLTSSAATIVDDYRNTPTQTTKPLGQLDATGGKTGFLEVAGDKDVFAVTLTAGCGYTFDLKGVAGNGGTLADPYLQLLNSGGTVLASHDNVSASIKDAQITFAASTSGTYYLVASNLANTGTGTYRITSKETLLDDYRNTPTDTTKPLGSLAAGASISGAIESNGDKDVFAITLAAGSSYTFDLKGVASTIGSLSDAFLELRNAAGTVLVSNDDFGGGSDSRITYTATANGTYYLVAGTSTTSGTGTYTLTASAPAIADDYRDSLTDTTAPLGTLAVGGARAGKIETSGDRDLIAISLVAGNAYTFNLAGSGAAGVALANGELRLLNASGVELLFNDDFNGVGSRLVYTPTVNGLVYLAVESHVAGGTGAYTVRATLNADDHADTHTDTTSPLGVLGSKPLLGNIEAAGDVDVFRVSLLAGKSYTFDLSGSAVAGAALTDPELHLLNASGVELRFNDDFNGFGSRIVYTPTTSGIYYLAAESHTASGTGTYQISSTLLYDDWRDTVTDATASFGQLSVNGSLLGSIERAGDRDLFAITLAAGKTYTFNLTGSSVDGYALANAELRLLNSSGTQLRFNDDFNSFDSRITFTVTTAGTYYLDVRGHGTGAVGTFQLSATLGFDDYRDSITDPTSPLGAVAIGGTTLGTIETRGDPDLFAVQLTAGTTYTFGLTGSNADGRALANGELLLFDRNGTMIDYGDTLSGSPTAEITYTAAVTGMHYLEASGIGSATGTYAVSAVQAPAAMMLGLAEAPHHDMHY